MPVIFLVQNKSTKTKKICLDTIIKKCIKTNNIQLKENNIEHQLDEREKTERTQSQTPTLKKTHMKSKPQKNTFVSQRKEK